MGLVLCFGIINFMKSNIAYGKKNARFSFKWLILIVTIAFVIWVMLDGASEDVDVFQSQKLTLPVLDYK